MFSEVTVAVPETVITPVDVLGIALRVVALTVPPER
jgi:hypothetical protein